LSNAQFSKDLKYFAKFQRNYLLFRYIYGIRDYLSTNALDIFQPCILPSTLCYWCLGLSNKKQSTQTKHHI